MFVPVPPILEHGSSAQGGSDPVKLQSSLGTKLLLLSWTHCDIIMGLRFVGLHSHGLEIHKGSRGCSPLQAPVTCPGWISHSG